MAHVYVVTVPTRDRVKIYRPTFVRLQRSGGGVHKWSVESVHTKNIVSILHLLVALARHFRAPIRLPEDVVVDVVIVTKREGILQHR